MLPLTPPMILPLFTPTAIADSKAVVRRNEDGTGLPMVTNRVFRQPLTKRDMQHLHEVDAAAAEFGRLPDRDEAVHAIMGGNFHGWDLVPAILKLATPTTIAELYVATLGFNARNAAELLRLLDSGEIGRVVFLCSHYFQKASTKEFEMLRAGLVTRGQTILATRTHAKILSIRLTDGRCIVVESSANLRSCNNLEQLVMTESPDLFAFHAKWIDAVSRCPKNAA